VEFARLETATINMAEEHYILGYIFHWTTRRHIPEGSSACSIGTNTVPLEAAHRLNPLALVQETDHTGRMQRVRHKHCGREKWF
jgi:hypothetical protein